MKSHRSHSITVTALAEFPMVEPGDDLTSMIMASLESTVLNGDALMLQDNDVLVLAQKIVSKSENRYAYLNQVQPSDTAYTLAQNVDKDPRLIEVILSESDEVIRQRKGVVIVAHKNGYVHANAGVDKSNIESDDDNPRVLLLPENPDTSASVLRNALFERIGVKVHIIINDSAGRAWRNGTTGMAIGTAGFESLEDLVGEPDLFHRPMEITQVAVADELAAAASFMMGQADEACPVVLIRGASLRESQAGSCRLIREKEMDLFR